MLRNALISTAILASAAVLWLSWSRVAEAHVAATQARSRFDEALRAERELAELRGKLPVSARGQQPTSDAAAIVQLAAREAGLRAQIVAEVSPQEVALLGAADGASVAPDAGAKRRRQSVQVRLNPLPLADVGAFLHELRAASDDWIVSQVDLRAEATRGEIGTEPAAVRFGLSLRLTCTYLERSVSPPSAAAPR